MGTHDVNAPLKVRITGQLRDEDMGRLEDALVQHYRRPLRLAASAAAAPREARPRAAVAAATGADANRERAHRLVAAVEDLLVRHTMEAAARANRWKDLDSPYMIDLRCREARDQVHRLEVALRTGEPIPEQRWRSAVGAPRMAQRYLERLVEPDGRVRVEAAIAAIERAAALVPSPPPPTPLKHGWHLIVDDTGGLLGYVEVVDNTYRRWYDADLEYVDGTDVSIESEGLGPLEYLALGALAVRGATRIAGRLAADLARSFSAHTLKKSAGRSVLVAGVMMGVAEAAPVVAGRFAKHAFILSETLTADISLVEAGTAARPVVSAAAELELPAAGGVVKPSVGGPVARAGATGAAPVAGGAVAPAAIGAAAARAPRYAASLGETAEGPNLRRYHPDAYSVPPKFRAYDAYEGGTVESYLTRERVKGRFVLVVNQVVSDARWISLKQVLEPKDVTPENVARHVDKALRDMERDASDRAARLPARDPEPVDEDTYLRVVKKQPKRVTLHITFPGPLPGPLAQAIEDAARDAALRSGRLGDLPPFDLLLNGKNVPLK